jgi:hypothetical protein
MGERWLKVASDAAQKRASRFEIWQSGQGISFASPEAEKQYQERATLFQDAIEMTKKPVRVPVCPGMGHFPLEYAGISWREAMYDYQKLAAAWELYFKDFNPDGYGGPTSITPGPALEMLDLKLYRWAGFGLEDDQEYQYVEAEYMKAEEYQDLIDDPSGYFLNVYFPRIFGALKPFEKFPLLPPIHEMPLFAPFMAPFGLEDMDSALQTLMKAGRETLKWRAVAGQVSADIMGRGIPSFVGGFAKAPFDVIGDSLRGTRGILTDMFRHPDMLLEACERITPFMVKCGVNSCKANNHLIAFIPLHKGADGFMSDDQFQTFYWPTLRKLIVGLINEGIVPLLFAEGGYNTRLEAICDIPEKSVIWWFDQTDMEKAKATVGQVACIAGNVPLDLLCTARPDEVEKYCENLIDVAGKDGGFIFSSGAGVQGAKAENVKAMIDCAVKYGVYK